MCSRILIVFFLLLLTQRCFAMKYSYSIFQACQKCEEHSKIFYEMKNLKLCTRCTLGYLSFHFPDQDHEAIKFYMTDILFTHLNHQKLVAWNKINLLVQESLKKEEKILETRKQQNKSCDLFLIVNQITTNFGINPLEKRKCQQCSKPRFHLMKLSCCKNFICISCCLDSMSIKCVLCRKLAYRTKENLRELQSFKADYKTLKVKDEFTKKKSLDKKKANCSYPEKEICARSYLPSKKIKYSIYSFSVLLQLYFLQKLTQDYQSSISWVNSNFMTSTIICGFGKDQKTLKSDEEIYAEITRELDIFFETWLKLLVPYFVYLFDAQAKNFILLLLISLFTMPLIHAISKRLVQHLKSYILEEEKFHFY